MLHFNKVASIITQREIAKKIFLKAEFAESSILFVTLNSKEIKKKRK
jgi:hypothetical protein